MRAKTRRAIFLKQWKEWRTAKDGFRMTRADYAMPPPWQVTVARTDPLIPRFFDAVWETR